MVVFSTFLTVFGNSATYGGGVRSTDYTPELMNCIVWGNSAPLYPQIYGAADIQYSDIESGYTGIGNMDEDPNFDDSTYFCLNQNSHCMDAGNPDPIYYDVEDPQNLGYPLLPARGTLINDMGHFGGPSSLWSTWDIPVSVKNGETENSIPSEFTLSQNFPNPFYPSTTIKYQIPELSFVSLKVYYVLGSEITTLVNEEKPIGSYEVDFSANGGSASGGNAYSLPRGIYFYRLQAGDPSTGSGQGFVETKKMVLLK
ncbi:MAG: hypothetical protein WBG58_18470 [Ignavibacteriaceae bacterium]